MRRANLNFLSKQYQLTKIKDDVSLNVANAFLQILYNKENLKVKKEQAAFSEKQFNRTKELVKAGSVARGDLLDSKATVSSNNQAIIVAENALLISKLSLAQLLLLPEFKDFDVEEIQMTPKKSETLLETPASIYERAKKNRVELKIAKTNLEIAEKDIKIARGAYQPSLQGFYSFSTRASNSPSINDVTLDPNNPTKQIGFLEGTNQLVLQPNLVPVLGGPNPIFDQFSKNKGQIFGFQLNVPILNGFSVRNNVERNKVNFERSKIAYQQQELDLERNVYTSFSDTKGAMNAYEAALTALEARTEAYNYAKEKFAVGIMNAFDLNQSQTLFVNAQSDVLRTKYDYIFKTKVLEFYFGIPIIQN